jgi:hypothetical protein
MWFTEAKCSLIGWCTSTELALDVRQTECSLLSRLAVGAGEGPGLTNRPLGETFGAESVTLSIAQMPAHNHTLSNGVTGNTGGSQPFDNTQPSLGVDLYSIDLGREVTDEEYERHLQQADIVQIEQMALLRCLGDVHYDLTESTFRRCRTAEGSFRYKAICCIDMMTVVLGR